MEHLQTPDVVNSSNINEEIIEDKNEDLVTSSNVQVIQFVARNKRFIRWIFWSHSCSLLFFLLISQVSISNRLVYTLEHISIGTSVEMSCLLYNSIGSFEPKKKEISYFRCSKILLVFYVNQMSVVLSFCCRLMSTRTTF